MQPTSPHNLDHDPPATPAEASATSPHPNDHCLKCGYSLRNLETYRCPECNHTSTENERALNQHYLKTTNRFATRCIFIPTGIFAGFSIVVFLIVAALHETTLEMDGLIVVVPLVTILYVLLQPWTLFFAAARLTQVQVMKRFAPAALAAEPTRAILVFLFHFTWMSIIPILTVAVLYTFMIASIR